MPITKKKGAIFAIYADSPTAPTSSTIPPPTSPSKRPTSKVKSILSDGKTSVPPLSGSTGRKALSSLQASAVKAKAASLSESKADDVDKPTLKPTLNARSSTSTTVKRNPSTRKTLKPAPPKRQIEALSSPTLPSDSTLISTALPPAVPSEKSTVRFKDTTAKSYESPLKRGGLTTPSRSTTKDKENIPPTLDSPASRTRSKTRRHANSISSLAGLGISSPIQTTSRARPQRTDSGVSGNSGFSAFALAPGPEMEDLGEDTVEEVRSLVGSGRGALSLKKGRALAGILGSVVDLGDDETLDLASSPAVVIGPATPGPKSAKSKSQGKGFWREGDGPLADVSEAYGATGEAPEGFTTQAGV